MTTPVSSPAASPDGPVAPAATRVGTPGWRDPRLWVGVLIVGVSVVVGVRLVGGADESVAVWSVTEDLAAGDTVDPGGLEARRVRFVEDGDLGSYLPVDEELPADLRLLRGVGAGELLPRAALGSTDDSGVTEASFTVLATQLPTSVTSGALVDVLVTPERGSGAAPEAAVVLEAVPVLDVPDLAAELGGGQERQVVVGIPDDQAELLPTAVGAASTGTVTLVRVGP